MCILWKPLHRYSWSHKILLADCIKCQTNKIFANNHNKANTEHLASTKTHFNDMIMIDTKGPINPPSDGHQYIFVIVDAFSHFVIIMCEIKLKPSTTYAPWTNGLVEGTKRIIGQFRRTLVDGKFNNGSRKAKFFPYAYNTQYQTRSRLSPYEVVFNRNHVNQHK